MAHIRVQDPALLTAAEVALIESSLPKGIKDLTPSRLKVQMARARRSAEKYRDLARRQRRERKRVSGLGRPTPPSNARTERKVTLLGDAASRFERRLEQLQQPKFITAINPTGCVSAGSEQDDGTADSWTVVGYSLGPVRRAKP